MEGLYLSFFRMPPALAEVHERERRIIQTIVWFSLSLIVSVFVKDIGYAVALIGGLAALFIFFFPGTLSEIKPRANGHNFVGYVTCCVHLHMLLYVVACCWEETSQTFEPLTPNISINYCTLYTYGLYPSHGVLQITTLFGYFRRTQKENRANRSS